MPRRLMFATDTSETGAGPATGPATPPGSSSESSAGQSTADGQTGTGEPDGEPDWRQKFEAQQKVSRDLERKLKAAIPKDEAENLRAQLAAAQGKEKEYEAERERAELLAEANSKANQRILKAEVRALASKKLADPADALLYIDLSDIQVDEDGQVDRAVIAERLEALVQSKPYLAAQGGKQVFESPTSAREGSDGKAQWTKEDLTGKTPAQINAARAEGRLDDLLGKKN